MAINIFKVSHLGNTPMDRLLHLLRLIPLLVCIFAISGCGESSETFYLYGPTKMCIAAKNQAECKRVKLYDKVELKVFPDRQEVGFSQAAIGLDASNTLFKRLENCKVVSDASFSCDGLTRSEGVFTDTSVFGSKLVSRSYWAYWYSLIRSDTGANRSTVQWWSDNHHWLTVVIFVFLILSLLGMATQ